MPSKDRAAPQLSLARAVYGFVTISFLAFAVVAGLLVSNRISALTDATLDRAVRIRTEAAANALARSLQADWQSLWHLSDVITAWPDAESAALMAGLRGDGRRVSWVGLADTSGIVQIASNGLLEGEDVSSRPWFRNGLQGPFGGDVHDALLLASYLDAPDGETLRFIDLALPVRNGDGEVTGVLGMHIEAGWVGRELSATANSLNLDLFLLAPNGDISIASTDERPDLADLAILRSAQSGVVEFGRETWPNGKTYFSSLVPTVTAQDLPNFGWRLLGRLDPASVGQVVDATRNAILLIALAAIAALALVTALFVHIFIRPIEALARSATRIAEGVDDFPTETGTTREAKEFSSALVRIQNQRDTAS